MAVKEVIDVTRRMTCSQNDGITLYASSIGRDNTNDTFILDDEIRNTGIEMVFATTRDYGFAYVCDDGRQSVGTNMSMDINHNVRIGPMFHQETQHLADISTLGGASVKFAITIGTSATFSKAPVTVRIHGLGTHEGDNIFLAFLYRFASFHNDGA